MIYVESIKIALAIFNSVNSLVALFLDSLGLEIKTSEKRKK